MVRPPGSTTSTIGSQWHMPLQPTVLTMPFAPARCAACSNNGGTLMVASFASAVTNGQSFQLLVAANGVYNTGTFSSVTLPSATGLTWTNTLSTNGRITAGVVVGPPPIPAITHIGLTGTTLRINGTNGVTGDTLYVLTSTNLALPLSQWKTNRSEEHTSELQ